MPFMRSAVKGRFRAIIRVSENQQKIVFRAQASIRFSVPGVFYVTLQIKEWRSAKWFGELGYQRHLVTS